MPEKSANEESDHRKEVEEADEFRKSSKAAFRSSQETMLSRTERIARVGSWEWEIERNLVTWSAGLFHIFQLDPAKAAPSWEEHSSLYHQDDIPCLRDAVEMAVSQGTPYELELRALRRDGEIRNVLAWGFPEVDPEGKVVRLHGSVQDITERKQAEVQLSESEKRYRTIFERNLNPIAIIGMDGRYLEANEAFFEFVEKTREELLGMTVIDFSLPEQKNHVEKVHRQIWERGATVETDYWINNTNKTLELTITHFSSKGVDAVIGVGKDITERKRAEEAIRKRLAYEQAVSQISSWAVETNDLSKFLSSCLDLLGKSVDVSRAYIFEHQHQTNTINNTVEWTVPGVTPQIEKLQDIPANAVPWWVEIMKSGQAIRFTDFEDIPNEEVKDVLRPQGILSILVIPLFVDKLYYGFMGFDECRRHREWAQGDVDLLFAMARIITGVIERKRAEKEKEKLQAQSIPPVNWWYDDPP
jgi:PAS domain S-box-containing protein